MLSLTLLVLGSVTDHPHDTLTPDDAALLADAFDGGTNFHAGEGEGGGEVSSAAPAGPKSTG